MRKYCIAVLFLLGSACFSPVWSQRADSLLLRQDSILHQIDSLLNTDESLSLFRLIDSIVQMPVAREKSMMSVRIGYNSNVAATSQTLGINQFGLSPGVSYFHRSGLYADASTYYSQEYTPNFYLSVLSGGYMKLVSKHWSFLAEYSRYLYSDAGKNTYIPYLNNLGTSHYFSFKPITLKMDYYFYFGQKKAHRIIPALMLNLEKRKWHKLDRIQLYPTFSVLFGSEKVTTDYIFYNDYLQRYEQNKTLPPDKQIPLFYEVRKNVFGVMNYAFLVPLSLTRKKTTLTLSYTYNIPKSLPHEDLGLKANGYVAVSITRYIGF